MMMNEYQTEAMSFRLPSANKTYAFLNLAAEAGEVCSLVAKFIRDGDQYPEDFKKSLEKELGDVMWMVSAIAADHNLSLSSICETNITKLTERKARNTINGSGDNR
jgi:NTP pyrophosphatase (non-canonical NTP hydrolase)